MDLNRNRSKIRMVIAKFDVIQLKITKFCPRIVCPLQIQINFPLNTRTVKWFTFLKVSPAKSGA